LKKYEIESLLKTFIIFFTLLEILLAINFYQEYQRELKQVENKISLEMKLCAYSLQCEGLFSDFVNNSSNIEINRLYQSDNFYSYYKVPSSKKYLIKITYPMKRYNTLIKDVEYDVIKRFILYTIISIIITLLFAFYALLPIRQAIQLNEEFVKDILHDFNTPISSMKINFKMLKKEIGNNTKIERIETNIETILRLQNNLQIFLKGLKNQADRFDLQHLVKDRILYFQALYSDIDYSFDIDSTIIITNKDAFIRILDNLLSNAGKYNKTDGSVKVYMKNSKLIIEDTGKGIKNPSLIFKRYYKEQDRGIGIGLHIVKKLCEELHIGIKVQSQEGVGTKMILNLSEIL